MRWVITAALGILVCVPSPSWRQRMLSASAVQFQADGYGEVTLTWSSPASTLTQIRIGSADGEVFSSGGSSGTAQTGRWVQDGTRFFLQDVSLREPGMTMATVTIHAAPSRSRIVHYIAASATSYNSSSGEPAGAVLIFDRDTTDQVARINFPDPAYPAVAPADGATLYVDVIGNNSGIAEIDLRTASVRAFVPLPKSAGPVVLAGDRLLAATFEPGVSVIDLRTNTIVASVPCAVRPEYLLYSAANRTAYGIGTTGARREICVITPELQAGAPIALDQTVNAAVLVDNGNAGILLLASSVQNSISSLALDLGTLKSVPVPSLDAVYPDLIRSRVLYGLQSDGRQLQLQRYGLTFAPDGAPIFTTEQGEPLTGVNPSTVDDRFLYTGVSGYCSTVEGPVTCSVGFRILDAVTLQQRPANGSVIFAQPITLVSGPTLFGPRAIGVGVAGSYTAGGRIPSPRPRSIFSTKNEPEKRI